MAALLDLSSLSLGGVYTGLLLLLIGGHLGRAHRQLVRRFLWIWVALVVLIGITVVMYLVATPYFRTLRGAVGIKSQYGPKDAPDPVPLPDAEVVALGGAGSRRRSCRRSVRRPADHPVADGGQAVLTERS